ncbi:MAG: beta strand repeat-containing protein, partial [Bacteroidota bacterium]
MVTSLTNAVAVGSGITTTVSSVLRTNTGVTQSLLSGNGNEYNIHAPWSDGNTYFDVSDAGTGRVSGALTWTSLSTGTFLRNGAIAEVYKNGINSLNSNSRNTSFIFSNSNIGLFSYGNNHYTQGVVPELLFFSTALSSSDRVAIENDQICYFGVQPTITLSSSPAVPANAASASIPYTATTLSPITYSITWDAASLAAGFTNVIDATLPASPITVTLPGTTTPGAIYAGTLTVKNACGTASVAYPISVNILNPILGTTQTAQGAYSIRKVSSTYNGPAIQVRRSSDNSTQDIGFTAGGDLDQAALLSFVGSGNGFITIWYDQSGNAVNMVQATAIRQPRIVNAGVLDTKNARPGLKHFASNQQFLTVGTGYLTTNNWTINSVQSLDGGVNQRMLSGTPNWLLGFWGGNESSFYFQAGSGATLGSGFPATTAVQVYTAVGQGASNAGVFRNGVNISAQGGGVASNAPTSLFTSSNQGGSEFSDGTTQELIVFNSSLSASDRQTIETSQFCYYSIPPTITITAIPAVPANSSSAVLAYTATSINPITYSITWDAAALAAGFTNVVDAALPASPISVTMPATTNPGSIFNGTLTVKTACGIVSANYPISISILNPILGTGVTAVNAYSVRKVNSSYAGFALQVRRSSDNTTQDIGFTASGDLDETALLAFVGSGSGFVTTWYDQSGNGRNITSSTTFRQPAIVNAGVVNLRNARPSLVFDGADDQLLFSAFPTTGFTGFSANMLCSWTTVGNAVSNIQAMLDNNHSGTGFVFQDRPDLTNKPLNVGYSGVGASDVITTGDGNLRVLSMVVGATTLSGFRDGFNYQTSARSGAFLHNNILSIGAWANGPSRFLNGAIPEVLIFPSALSTADRQTIESNQLCYYSVPPTISLGQVAAVPENSATASLPYTTTTSNPNTYSITWDAVALAAGFTNVVDAALSAGNIALTLPAVTTAGSIYNGTLTVKNACGITSINYPISIPILNPILGTGITAVNAYSVRKLNPNYAGFALRVRRSGDDATQDIGFTASGDLDQVALLAFVGSENGFISTWYDQSGNGRNITSSSISRQPAIVSGGVVNLRNARPSLVFDGVDDQLLFSAFPTTGFTGFSANMLCNWTTIGSAVSNIQALLDNNHSGTGFIFQDRPDLTNKPLTMGYTGGGPSDVITTGDGNLRVLSMVVNSTSNAGFRDGLNFQTVSRSGAFLHNNILSIGAWANGPSRYLNGAIPEVLIFPSALSTTDRQTIENNQFCYYSLPPTIALGQATSVPANTASVSLPYTITTANPVTYSITWDAAAFTAGFTNVVDAALPASPITIALPTTTPFGGVYNGILTVKSSCGVVSTNYPIVIRTLSPILGTTQTAQAAYALRKVAATYNGPAIRVRR